MNIGTAGIPCRRISRCVHRHTHTHMCRLKYRFSARIPGAFSRTLTMQLGERRRLLTAQTNLRREREIRSSRRGSGPVHYLCSNFRANSTLAPDNIKRSAFVLYASGDGREGILCATFHLCFSCDQGVWLAFLSGTLTAESNSKSTLICF